MPMKLEMDAFLNEICNRRSSNKSLVRKCHEKAGNYVKNDWAEKYRNIA
jgi:hypothetical protein